ncbi:MAG: TonB-dependent receptor, partial [Candidatus Nephrothrix sp. EaCA]
MKTKIAVLWLVLMSVFQYGLTQTHIRGRVTDAKGRPLMYAHILLKNSYDGAVTDSLGQFLLPLNEMKDSLTLEARMTGYASAQQKISKAEFNKPLWFALRQELSVLEEVLVTAGSFEAGDKKRASAVLNTLDVLTTAGSNADIMAAIRTLPGAQKVGNQTGLFVRGGSGNETKQFIDGTLVNNPFYPSAPDLAQRARFSPYLFKGI